MINDKLRKLIEVLTYKTKKREAIWNKTSADKQFKLLLSDGIAVTVTLIAAGFNYNEFYNISIYNKSGEVIQSYHTDENTSTTDFELVKMFYEAARDEYFQVDKTIDALLKSVNSQGVIGEMDDDF